MAQLDLNYGTGSTNYRGIMGSGNQAVYQRRSTPNAPVANRGPDGINKIVATQMVLDIAGYGTSANANAVFKVFSDSGTLLSASPATALANTATTTINLPSVTGNITNVALDGGVIYRFGYHCSAASGYQKQVNTAFNLYVDTSQTAGAGTESTLPSVIAENVDRTLIGYVTYVYSPSAPESVTASDITINSATVSWTAPADIGDSSIQRYYVEYRPSGGSWTSAGTYTNGTTYTYSVTGLTPSTSYEFRVQAYNGASPTLGFNSAWGTSSAYTTLSDGDLYINVAGVWKKGQVYANVGGTWREGEAWVNAGGTWYKGTP